MELPTVLLGVNVVQVVKPTGNMLVSPVRPGAIEAVIIFAVSLVRTHPVFFGEVADNGEEVPEFQDSACNLDPGLCKLRMKSVRFSIKRSGSVPYVF